jgi:hypothetical protein
MLRNFWPEQKIAAWEAEVFPNGSSEMGVETAANMITLCPNAHEYWNKGAFALKPISVSDDNTTLTIQFFWQAKHEQIESTVNLLTMPPCTRDLDSGGKGYSHLADYHQLGVRTIKSGDMFVIKTDDPEARPLPSIALLEMQWFLQRVMGMAGAADVEEEMEEDPDDWCCEGTVGATGVTDPEELSDSDYSRSGHSESGDVSFLPGSDSTTLDSRLHKGN